VIRPGTLLRTATAGGATVLTLAAVLAWSQLSRPATRPDRAPPASPVVTLQVPRTVLLPAHTPSHQQLVRLQSSDVQESCVGRPLPGDLERVGGPVTVIDGNPLTSWHCDGDGARLRPPQSLTIFFSPPVVLTRVGVIGYDPYRPCRFVTRMALLVGRAGYLIRLPQSRYSGLRWFAVPPVRASQIRLVVMATQVPPGRHGPICARTAIAKVGFAQRLPIAVTRSG
jgi:hypothetical protein